MPVVCFVLYVLLGVVITYYLMQRKERVVVKIKKLSDKATLPKYALPGDSGFDLCAAETVELIGPDSYLISTDLCFEIPEGYEMQIRPRSGLSKATSLIIPNSPGTIDSGYRGPVKIMLRNYSFRPYLITRGTKIAQGVIVPVIHAKLEVAASLSETVRGDKGFGSTGI